MITTPIHDDIRVFAAAVRAHLDDLPTDDVDDLLDGLEADLSDQAAESGDAFTLPDATTYAAELRAAAGLPERGASERLPRRDPILERVKDGWRAFGDAVRANPAGAWLLDLFVALRPVWWVLRAVVLYLLIAPSFVQGYGATQGMFPSLLAALRFPGLVLMGLLLLLSIQWGRGRWLPRRPVRGIRTVVNVVAVILTPFSLFGLVASAQTALWDQSWSAPSMHTPGLAVDGERVRNIYAYDAAGNPIPSVQLFDQDGKPLKTVDADNTNPWDDYFAGGGGPVPVPETVPGSVPAWNVFPLREVPADTWTWNPDVLPKAVMPSFPFERVQPLPDADSARAKKDATPAPTPTATASPQPDAVAPTTVPTTSVTP